MSRKDKNIRRWASAIIDIFGKFNIISYKNREEQRTHIRMINYNYTDWKAIPIDLCNDDLNIINIIEKAKKKLIEEPNWRLKQ